MAFYRACCGQLLWCSLALKSTHLQKGFTTKKPKIAARSNARYKYLVKGVLCCAIVGLYSFLSFPKYESIVTYFKIAMCFGIWYCLHRKVYLKLLMRYVDKMCVLRRSANMYQLTKPN